MVEITAGTVVRRVVGVFAVVGVVEIDVIYVVMSLLSVVVVGTVPETYRKILYITHTSNF